MADDSVGLNPGDSVGADASRKVADYTEGAGATAEGRGKKGGVADDSVGAGDDAEGRGKKGGVADDSVGAGDDVEGRGKKGGVADDSVGGTGADDKPPCGPGSDLERELLETLNKAVETPGCLKTPPALPDGSQPFIEGALGSTGLPEKTGQDLLDAAKNDATVAARLDSTLHAAGTMPGDIRDTMLATFAKDPNGPTGAIITSISNSEGFRGLPEADQRYVATVLANADERGLKLTAVMLEKTPTPLMDRDVNGNTLATNLATIATQPLNGGLAEHTTTAQVLSNMLTDVANPERIAQGTAPTCTVTSMQYELVRDNPAEYARLMVGLTGPTGDVAMRGNQHLQVTASDADSKALTGRSVTQAIFQASAMEFANGAAADYNPITQRSTNTVTGEVHAGLNPAEQTQALNQLFGVTFTTKTFYTQAEGAAGLDALRDFDSREHINRPVILEIDQGDVNHAVTLDRVADGKVYYRDPYGKQREMTEAQFVKYVVAVHEPREPPIRDFDDIDQGKRGMIMIP